MTLTASLKPEFVRAKKRKKQLDWLATNTDDITPSNHIRFLLVRAKKNRKVKNGLKVLRSVRLADRKLTKVVIPG